MIGIKKTYIGKKRGKYAIYSLVGRKQLTKFYSLIEKLDENVYIAKDEKTEKLAFLSARFSTKNEYTEIFKVLDTEINEYLYIGIIEEKREIDILSRVDRIDIRELGKNEFDKIFNLLPQRYKME